MHLDVKATIGWILQVCLDSEVQAVDFERLLAATDSGGTTVRERMHAELPLSTNKLDCCMWVGFP